MFAAKFSWFGAQIVVRGEAELVEVLISSGPFFLGLNCFFSCDLFKHFMVVWSSGRRARRGGAGGSFEGNVRRTS